MVPPISSQLVNKVLRNARIPSDGELFSNLYGWVDIFQSKESDGAKIAITLLYCRLLRAFDQRKAAAATLQSTNNVNTHNNQVRVGHRVVFPSNMDLSPNVSESLFHVASDIANAQTELPESMRNWSIAQVAMSVHALFNSDTGEEATSTMLRRVKRYLQNDTSGLQQKFQGYVIMVSQWIAGRVIRAVEAYQDFVSMWDEIEWNEESYHFESIPSVDPASRNNQIQPESAEYISKIQQLQRSCWIVSCFLSTLVQVNENEGRIATRRQRLLASASSILLAAVLAQNDEPVAKKRKLNLAQEALSNVAGVEIDQSRDVVQAILEAANKEAAFTRWAAPNQQSKVACDMDEEELLAACKSLVNNLLICLKGAKHTLEGPTKGGKFSFIEYSKTVMETLPQLASGLYLRGEDMTTKTKVKVEACLYLNEASLVTFENFDHFCSKIDFPAEVSNAAVVATEKSILDAVVTAEKRATNVGRRAITPPIMTDNMELSEWATAILNVETVKPSKKLLRLFENSFSSKEEKPWYSIIVPILNKTILQLCQENVADKLTRTAPVQVHSEPEPGIVSIHGTMTSEKQTYKALIALYYHAIESILMAESSRHPMGSITDVITNDKFHKALLACCSNTIIKAVGVTHKFRPEASIYGMEIYSILLVCDSNPYDFIKVAESYRLSLTPRKVEYKLGSPLMAFLPRILLNSSRQVESNVLDSLLWARDPKFEISFPDLVEEFQERTANENICYWPCELLDPSTYNGFDYDDDLNGKERVYPTPGSEDYAEYRSACHVIRRLLNAVINRTDKMCLNLRILPDLRITQHVMVAFRHMLRHKVELLFDRHVDQLLLCTLYGVLRSVKYKPDITFAQIIDTYVATRGHELGDITCQRICRHINLNAENPSDKGNVINFYNKVFVHAMKEHLLNSTAIREAAQAVRENLESRGMLNLHFKYVENPKTELQFSEKPVVTSTIGRPDLRGIDNLNQVASGQTKSSDVSS